MNATISIRLYRPDRKQIAEKHKEALLHKAFRHATGLVGEGYREGELVFADTQTRPYRVGGWWELKTNG